MKNGYDQFFKKAQKVASRKGAAQSSVSAAKSQHSRGELEELVKKKFEEVHSKKKKSKKNGINWKLATASFLGMVVALVGIFEYETIEKYVKKVEINFMGFAHAEEAKHETSAGENKAEAKKEEPKVNWDAADVDHLSKLIERKKALDTREEEIARQEEELGKQKLELEKKIAEMEKVRGDISKILEDRVKRDNERIDNLVSVYSNMKAAKAANVLETLDKDLAVEILGRMKKKNAADILNAMKPEKTQSISEMYAGYKK
ncbi:MAG: MotE family protein [Pseudobdellovibrionaceae bacterium]